MYTSKSGFLPAQVLSMLRMYVQLLFYFNSPNFSSCFRLFSLIYQFWLVLQLKCFLLFLSHFQFQCSLLLLHDNCLGNVDMQLLSVR